MAAPKRIDSRTIENNNRVGFKLFPKGARHLLHPNFEEIDSVDCLFLYETQNRFFYVEYSPDLNGKYQKKLLTTHIDMVVETIQESL